MSRSGSNDDATNGRGPIPPGVPMPHEAQEWDEDTGPLRAGLAATAEGNPTAHAIATALSALMKAEAPPPPPPPAAPPIDAKRTSLAIKALIGIIAVCGGAFATYKATEARSVSNEAAIDSHAKLPAHPEADEKFRLIHVRIGTVQTELSGVDGEGGIKGDIKAIAEGVQSLKQEAQTDKQKRLEEKVLRLEQEKRDLEDELR